VPALAQQFYLTRLRSQLESAKRRLYPAGKFSPTLWFEYIAGLLDTAEHFIKIAALENESVDRLDSETALSLLVAAYKMLDEMDGAQVPQIAYAVVNPLTRWFNQIDSRKSFYFRSQNRAEYELQQFDEPEIDEIRYRHPNLEKARKKIRWPVEFVTVPGDAFGTVLHLSLVAHEAGHVAFDRHSKKLYQAVDLRTGLKKRALIKKALNESNLDAKKDTDLVGRLPEYTTSWVEETFADAACFYMTGPAGFFSLNEMCQMSDWNQSPRHPPAGLRLQLFKKALDQGKPSFTQIINKQVGKKVWKRWPMEAPTNGPQILPNIVTGAVISKLSPAIAWYESIAPHVFQAALDVMKSTYPELVYSPVQFENDLKNFSRDLSEAIPPIETGLSLSKREPATITAILNVGWMSMVGELRNIKIKVDAKPHLQRGAIAERLHGLLLKAIELSEIRLQWEETRCQFSVAERSKSA
jgi:hypothetical protein